MTRHKGGHKEGLRRAKERQNFAAPLKPQPKAVTSQKEGHKKWLMRGKERQNFAAPLKPQSKV